MEKFLVLWGHIGDKSYKKGDIREAHPATVKHLVKSKMIRPITDEEIAEMQKAQAKKSKAKGTKTKAKGKAKAKTEAKANEGETVKNQSQEKAEAQPKNKAEGLSLIHI